MISDSDESEDSDDDIKFDVDWIQRVMSSAHKRSVNLDVSLKPKKTSHRETGEHRQNAFEHRQNTIEHRQSMFQRNQCRCSIVSMFQREFVDVPRRSCSSVIVSMFQRDFVDDLVV